MSGSPKYDGALRDIQSPTGLHYRSHETPEDLAVLTPRVAQEPEDFEISDSEPRLAADVGAVAECLRDGEEPSTGLPARFVLTFSPQQVAALSEYVDGTALPILRWRPDRSVEPLEIAQSREWHAEDEAD